MLDFGKLSKISGEINMPYTAEVFGIAAKINNYSYVDRDNLDKKLMNYLKRQTHIAIKGPSKCGKSWLRQKCMANAITVQCRLGMKPEDIYRQALSDLGIPFDLQSSSTTTLAATGSGSAKLKMPLVAGVDLGGELSASHERNCGVSVDFSTSIDNLKFIANSIVESGKRLVIEDFHYLELSAREKLAHDLKTLWDYNCFVVIIGVWTQANLLTYLNPDLSGRIQELSICWSEQDLHKVIENGTIALNIEIDPEIKNTMVKDSFGNVGILQSLLLIFVEEEADISETLPQRYFITNPDFYRNAAKTYASQLDGLYQQFAQILSTGIRHRKKSTGIYALSMQAIVEANDTQLIKGYSRADIFEKVNAIEPRIQKGNLKTVLQKLVELQKPENGRELVISYDSAIDAVFATDLQLLFYRKHHSMKWPWEDMAEEARKQSLFEADEEL